MSLKKAVKKVEAAALGLLFAISSGATTSAAPDFDAIQADPPIEAVTNAEPETAPGEVLVKFKALQVPDRLPESHKIQVLRSMLPAAADRALADLGADVIRADALTGLLHLSFDRKTSVAEAIKLLDETGAVEYAEPNYRIRVVQTNTQAIASPPDVNPPLQAGTPSARAAVAPNDPRFKEQWALHNTGQTGGSVDADIDATDAWGFRTDGSAAVVAVLSSGIDYTHVDLAGNMWKNPGETSCTDKIDNDANGYIDDCYGIDTYLDSGNPMDDNGIGTHAAGIVGAVGNNAKGVSGVAWKAKLMGLRFLDAEGWGWTADAVQAIEYAIRIKIKNNYRMILLSEQISAPYSKALYDSLAKAQTNGLLVVTGARQSNDYQDVWSWYPGSYDLPNIITVTGTDANDYRSNQGHGSIVVDLGAPGTNILSTWLTNTYKLQTGTTQAAAHVAGAAALAWSANPTKTWKHVKELILNSAENGLRGFDWWLNMTNGRLNLHSSLVATAVNKPAIFSVSPAVTEKGQPVTLTGINFGTSATGHTISHVLPECSYTFPGSAIVSWKDEKIITQVSDTCRYGRGLLKVSAGSTAVARGAMFRVNRNPDGYLMWIDPTYQGSTLMEHEEAAFAQIGNYMWIIGGRSYYGSQTGNVERFSLLTMRGEVRPEWEMPLPVRQAGAAAIGSKIYVVGGYDDVTKRSVSALQIFDTTTNTWKRGRNLPKALAQPSVVSVSNKLWVMGGRDPNNLGLKTNYLYDPATNQWQTKASLPIKRAYAGVATPIAGQIWLVSGYTESGGSWYRTKDIMTYTIATNTWDIRDDIPLNGEHAAGGVINIGAKVFALYGDGDWEAGEWLANPKVGAGNGWYRNIGRGSSSDFSMGTYTPMLGKIGTTVYMISGSRGHAVFKFTSP